jgi:hypothetical protein
MFFTHCFAALKEAEYGRDPACFQLLLFLEESAPPFEGLLGFHISSQSSEWSEFGS